MSDYVKTVDFAAKDALASGNPSKLVLGTELNTEFANIATAVATKANSSSPTLTTPNIGTPSAGTLTNCTGLPVSTGISGLGTGVAAFLATPSSANLAAAVTGETGSGALVFATSPSLTTPNIGTPSAGVLTNCTGTAAGLTAGAATTATTATFATSAGGSVYQIVEATTSAASTGSTALPMDNTIPQNTEGDQILTVNITPISATSTLIIEVAISACQSNGSIALALFKDSGADAIAAVPYFSISSTSPSQYRLTHKMTSGGTSAATFNVRVGSSAGTTYFNRTDGGSQFFGGVMLCFIRVFEVRP